MKKTLLIFGGHSTALEIYEVANRYYKDDFKEIFFVIGDSEEKKINNQLFDFELQEFLRTTECVYIISFSNHKLRIEIEALMNHYCLSPINIIHPHAIISEMSNLGKGNYIAANAAICYNATINNHNIINYNVIIGHDAFISEHVIINPGAVISGNVKVGTRVLIGANSFIFQGKSIGNDTLIDALTYIDQDIEDKMICSSKKLSTFKRVIF